MVLFNQNCYRIPRRIGKYSTMKPLSIFNKSYNGTEKPQG